MPTVSRFLISHTLWQRREEAETKNELLWKWRSRFEKLP
jgi:hypothetical protein